MRYAALLAALGLLLGAGWATVTIVRGAEGERASSPAAPADESAAPAQECAPRAKDIKLASAAPAKSPAAPVKTAPAATASAPPKTADITPPAPLPDFEIPPIPEVSKDPYKPGPGPVRTSPPDVIEEGKRIFSREGRLDMDPLGRSMFAFNSGDKPMYLLENSWREYLENVTDHGARKVRWRVSGIITVYGGRNYLLLTKIVHVLPEEENR